MRGRQKCANSARKGKVGSGYRLQVQRIEERLLPGDTLGHLLLFSLGLSIDPFAAALAGRAEEPSAESASHSQASLAAISDSATDEAHSSWLAISSRPLAADTAHVGNA